MHTPARKVIHISIEGNIGVGKSTVFFKLKNAIGHLLRVEFVPEPVDEWLSSGFLQAQYDGTLNKCAFQHLVLMSLAADFGHAVSCENRILVVTERSPVSNYHVFAKQNLSGLELEAYRFVWDRFMKFYPEYVESHYIYLRASVDSLVQRRKERNRDGESCVDTEYIQGLQKKHDEWIASACNARTVDADAKGELVFQRVCDTIIDILEAHSACPRVQEASTVLKTCVPSLTEQ